MQGGLNTRYKRFIAEKGIPDETYDEKKTALFRVQGTSPNNMQAIQVDQVSQEIDIRIVHKVSVCILNTLSTHFHSNHAKT